MATIIDHRAASHSRQWGEALQMAQEIDRMTIRELHNRRRLVAEVRQRMQRSGAAGSTLFRLDRLSKAIPSDQITSVKLEAMKQAVADRNFDILQRVMNELCLIVESGKMFADEMEAFINYCGGIVPENDNTP